MFVRIQDLGCRRARDEEVEHPTCGSGGDLDCRAHNRWDRPRARDDRDLLVDTTDRVVAQLSAGTAAGPPSAAPVGRVSNISSAAREHEGQSHSQLDRRADGPIYRTNTISLNSAQNTL